MSAAVFNPVKAIALPQNPAPHTLYFIKSGNDVRVKGYVSDANATVFPLGIIDEQDVRSVLLDGFTVGSDTPIVSTNSIFTAFRNVQAQLNTLSTAVAGGIKIPQPIDCSANPNYPPATAGDSYIVSVAGRIGGASGLLVEVGDKIVARQTNAGGTQAAVGSSWYILQSNIDKATTTTFGTVRIATQQDVDAFSTSEAYVSPATLGGGVRLTVLTGFSVGTNSSIGSSDTVLGALGKVQGQINARLSTVNLGYTASPTNGVVTNTGGTSATIPLATTTNAGLFEPADKTKLNGIAAGAQVNVATNISYDNATRVISSSTGTGATLPVATASVDGLAKLFSNTVQSVVANSVSATSSRSYGIQLNSSGQLVVNVPWTDNDTQYTGSTSIILNGTSFERATLTGDVTASQNSNATTIANNAVSNAKFRQSAGFSVVGKTDAGTGNVNDIIAGTDGVLRRSGSGNLEFGTLVTNNIGDSQVTLAKIVNINGSTILGNNTANPAAPIALTASQVRTLLNVADGATANTGTVTSVGLSSSTSGVTIGSTPITTSGTITIAIATATGSQNGLLSSADWTTFNGKQNAITLTTTGSSGSSTLVGSTLNIPSYTLAGLGGVPTTRELTINGTAFDLSANRSWSVGTVTSVSALTIGTTGTDITSTVANGTTTPTITLNIPTASATNRGALSSADWTTFNTKIGGTIASGQVAFGTASGVIGGDNDLFWDNTNKRLGIGTTGVSSKLTIVSANTVLASDGILQISASESTEDTGGQITFRNGVARRAAIAGRMEASTGVTGYLQFGTRGTSGDITERWRITSTGVLRSNGAQTIETSTGALTLQPSNNVLIGTTTDGGQRFQVAGTVALRASTTASAATQIPVFTADPASTTRELVTRTPAQLLGDAGGISGTGTTNQLAYFTGASTIASLSTATYPSLTELSYVKGVTSAIQTQINGKQPLATNLTSLAGLTFASTAFVKMTSAGTFALDTNTYLTGNQSISLTGDATGSGTTSIAVTLANSGVTIGTYRSVTVDAKGRVTAGTNPTTISGYGITDFYSQVISGFVTGANTSVLNTDNLEVAIEKLQGQVNARITGNQSITLSGDVTGSGTTAITATIANNAVTTAKILDANVTYAKIQNVTENRILGRLTTAGSAQELTATQVRTLLNVSDGANNYTHPNHSGDVTSVGDGATTIASNAVSNAKFRQSAGFSVVGKMDTGTGNVADIVAGTDTVLRRSGSGNLEFGTLVTNNIGNSQVTLAKIANIAANSILGNNTANPSAPIELTQENVRTFLGFSTVGTSFTTLTNPSAVSFIRINADNTVSALSDSDFRTAIGAGTSSLNLGETSTTAYRGDRGKIAYDYSQVGHIPNSALNTYDPNAASDVALIRDAITTHNTRVASDSGEIVIQLRVSDFADFFQIGKVGNIIRNVVVDNNGVVTDIDTDFITTGDIDNGIITLPKIANIATSTILGNNTANPTAPIALTASEVRTLLNVPQVQHTHVVSDIVSITAKRLLGRFATTTGAGEQISLGANLDLSDTGVLTVKWTEAAW